MCISCYFCLCADGLNCLQMGDQLLPHLMEGDINERICVRVARFWELYSPQDESRLLHTDMVLIDEEVHIIP